MQRRWTVLKYTYRTSRGVSNSDLLEGQRRITAVYICITAVYAYITAICIR